jgi:glyoxalase family protein
MSAGMLGDRLNEKPDVAPEMENVCGREATRKGRARRWFFIYSSSSRKLLRPVGLTAEFGASTRKVPGHRRKEANLGAIMTEDPKLNAIVGLHHVTAIASNPQRNLDFYTGVLGMRLVKRTINFDDPGIYHFYFGDSNGSPGTILTFFPWPNAERGLVGSGETAVTAFSVPANSLQFWESRLLANGVPIKHHPERFGARVLSFSDPDGMLLELVEHTAGGTANTYRHSSLPAEYAIRGFFGVTLNERDIQSTGTVLEGMGFDRSDNNENRFRFSAEGDGHGRHIDILELPRLGHGAIGAGSVHHIAFRVSDDASQRAWRQELLKLSLDVTPVLDRTYFHSIYFREPGGVLFEIATDAPGFSFDEPLETLGESLKLPDWLESKRSKIEKILPPISLHSKWQNGKA